MKILILGSTGFLGSHILDLLDNKHQPYGRNYDLTDYESGRAIFNRERPDVVINCAGFNGGIEYNRLYPADILSKNTLICDNVHKLCVQYNASKLISIISSCAYPDGLNLINEEDLFGGEPNASIRAHAYAKRYCQLAAQYYNEQYKLNSVCVGLTNLFGPRATFNPERSKVVEAVIRKCVEGQINNTSTIEFWGTGSPLREFMYVKDAARAILSAVNYDDSTKPLNIGSGEEISIKDLVLMTAKLSNYNGRIRWIKEKGDGQMKKLLNSSNMPLYYNEPLTEFEDALMETIEWYKQNREYANAKK